MNVVNEGIKIQAYKAKAQVRAWKKQHKDQQHAIWQPNRPPRCYKLMCYIKRAVDMLLIL